MTFRACCQNPEMIDVCLEHPCGVINMHMQGSPKTMQIDPRYTNVVEEIFQFFSTWLTMDVERMRTSARTNCD